MTLLQDFDIDDAIRMELVEYDYIVRDLKECDETDIHHSYLVNELIGSMNNLIGHGFYLLEWNKDGPFM